MAPGKPFLSVIIPAYHAGEFIERTILDIDKKLSPKSFAYEIIVVNDGSKDETAEAVRKVVAGGAVKHLKLVDNPENRGKGGVVRQGMLLAAGQYRLFTDADNATSIDHFDLMLPWFEKGYDVVIGSRTVKGSRLDPPEPWYRQILGKAGNLFWIQLLLLPGLWDTQCGFKAFTAASAERVFALSRIARWSFDVEILALAEALGYKIKEIPVHWVHDERSTFTGGVYLQFLIEVAKIRWWLWRDRYNIHGHELSHQGTS